MTFRSGMEEGYFFPLKTHKLSSHHWMCGRGHHHIGRSMVDFGSAVGLGNKTFLQDAADVLLCVDLHPGRHKPCLSQGCPYHQRLWLLHSINSMVTQLTFFGQNFEG
uniref:Uncharacterized protein n=1 Tax=Lepeophtheirus salmonis TaxID=72036 RepID=A0A0K2TFN4_LEPSM